MNWGGITPFYVHFLNDGQYWIYFLTQNPVDIWSVSLLWRKGIDIDQEL